MSKQHLYTQSAYAKLKDVTPQYIYKLMKKKKLKTVIDMEDQKFYILDCEENNNLFKNKV